MLNNDVVLDKNLFLELLKTFEEPTPGTYFFIIASTSGFLLSTLRSRLFIEKLGIISVIGIPLAYSFFDPRGVQQIMQEHPTYTSGMIGAGLSAILAAKSDVDKKSLERRF